MPDARLIALIDGGTVPLGTTDPSVWSVVSTLTLGSTSTLGDTSTGSGAGFSNFKNEMIFSLIICVQREFKVASRLKAIRKHAIIE